MGNEFTKENALKVFTLDSLEALGNFELELRDLKKKFNKGNFSIKITNRLIFRNGEKSLMKGTPSNIVQQFNLDPGRPPYYVMNYFSREVYVHVIDRVNGCVCTKEMFNRINERYENHIVELNEIPDDYSSKKEFNLIKKDLNLLIRYLMNECDLTKDELRLMSDYFKESSYKIGSLINR